MKKTKTILLGLISTMVLPISLISCHPSSESDSVNISESNKVSETDESVESSVSTKLDYDMSNVRFENKTFIYDGKPHTLEIEGILPDGVSVIYSNNELTEVGSVEVTALFFGDEEHYNKIPSMTATLTIEKANYDLSQIKFEDKSYIYDGKPHTLEIEGTLPDGVSVTYTNNTLTEVGSIEVTASFKGDNKNYNEIPSLTATLTITYETDDFGNYIVDGIKYKDNGSYISVIGLNDNNIHEVTLKDTILNKPVTTIDSYAFSKCSNLTSITISNKVTTIDNYAFEKCTNLSSVTIPNGVTSIGKNAFIECSSLSSIDLPDSITSIGSWAFAKCTSLTSITIPKRVTTINASTFYSCNKLIEISLPDNITSIEDSAFNSCTSLAFIIIPMNVVSIKNNAFYACYNLVAVTISNSLKTIGNSAFGDCFKLKYVYYFGTSEEWNSIQIEDNNQYLLNATIRFESTTI